MDSTSTIKVLLDSYLENGKLLMCAIHRERSGSILFKLRIEEIGNGDQNREGGEATPNSNMYFRRKNQKQIDRDCNRSSIHHQTILTKPPAYNLRSHFDKSSTEKPRSTPTTETIDSKLFSSEVPSPIEIPALQNGVVLVSPDPILKCATEETPEPLKHASVTDESRINQTIEPENESKDSILSIDPAVDINDQQSSDDITSTDHPLSDQLDLKSDNKLPTKSTDSTAKKDNGLPSLDQITQDVYHVLSQELGKLDFGRTPKT